MWMTRFTLPGKCGGFGASGLIGPDPADAVPPSSGARPISPMPTPQRASISRRERSGLGNMSGPRLESAEDLGQGATKTRQHAPAGDRGVLPQHRAVARLLVHGCGALFGIHDPYHPHTA